MSVNFSVTSLILAFGAGLATAIGGVIVLFSKNVSMTLLSRALGFATGVMASLALFEMYPDAQKSLMSAYSVSGGTLLAIIAFASGAAAAALIETFIPYDIKLKGSREVTAGNAAILRLGILSAAAITLHNLPEGMSVFLSSVQSPSLGTVTALAMAVHNVPEGIAVALPIWIATRRRRYAFLIALLSGLSEPFGAVIAFLLMRPFLTHGVMGMIFALTAGIMTYIAALGLWPSAVQYGGAARSALWAALGMAVMLLGLFLLH